MRYLILIFTLFVVTANCLADAFDRRVRTHLTDAGIVYYVGNKKLSNADASIKLFEYDLTYVEDNDSVTVNFTLVSANPSDVSALTIGNGRKQVEASSVSLLFHETKGKAYEVRTTSRVLFSDLKLLFSDGLPITFSIRRADGQLQKAHYTESQWKKEKILFDKVFYMITK